MEIDSPTRRHSVVRIAALLPFLSLGLAAESDPTQWSPDDLLLAESADGFEIAPDGLKVAWVKSRMDPKQGERVSNLFLSSLTEKADVQLTRGKQVDTDPRWSPDGRYIAFLRTGKKSGSSEEAGGEEQEKEEEKANLWLIDTRGGEPWLAFEGERLVKDFRWRGEESVVYLAQEDPALYEQEVKKAKDTSVVVEDSMHEPPVRLYLLSIRDKKVRRITRNNDWIQQFELSPDGHWAAALHSRSLSFTFDHRVTPIATLIDLETGQVYPVNPGTRYMPSGLKWDSRSGGFYYSVEYSSDPFYYTATVRRLHYCDLASRATVEVDLAWGRGLAGDILPNPEGFLALLADGAGFKAARYRRTGTQWTREDLIGEHQGKIWDWASSRDGDVLVYEHSTAEKPDQWYQARLSGSRIEAVKRLTDLNPSFSKKPIHRSELIRWEGANGDEVEGILHYPVGYQEGSRYPLMLSIHGGPSGVDLDAWAEDFYSPKVLLSQKGAFVLEVNYHGSGNYGLKWVESICCGQYYDLERIDIENGVDHLIRQGLVDPERLGTMGWSNGAILTTELVTRNNRYKVASAGAGDVEWISDWGNVIFGASFDNYYFGKAPYQDPQLYIRKSPYFRLENVTTPTILYTGTKDVNVPPSQSWSHYRVLQQATRTPVRFLLFPDEPHGLSKYQHQKRKLEEDLAWFDKYFFLTEKEATPPIRKGSALETALARSRAEAHEGRFGHFESGVLMPAMVEFSGIRVSPFEVTRAQFAFFDPTYEFPSGTENFPASEIGFSQAQAYAEWLTQISGRRFRLPGPKEAEALYGEARANENTLDYWVGYTSSPEDLERLESAISSLPGPAPLLKEVGQFAGTGGPNPVFDLGGNVAEWVEGEQGGELRGGSADRPVDAKDSDQQAALAYRGFRLIEEPQ